MIQDPVRKIAILGSRGYPGTYGGFETAVRYIADDWVSKGLEVTVFCRNRKDGKRAWTDNGVKCRWTPGLDNKSLSTLSFGLTSNIEASPRPIDAALVLNIANGFFLPILRHSGIGIALNTDGIEWERGKWGSGAQKVFLAGAKASAKYAEVLVADSNGIADIWREKFGVESEFIPYGAPVLESAEHNRVRDIGIEPGSYALVVEKLIPENNVELTLDAFPDGPQVPTIIVGVANYQSPIENRLRKLDENGNSKWLGHVHDQELLNQLWSNAGVYIHGHSVEGTNPALLQALGAGAPTLALDTGFNREVVDNDEQLYPVDAKVLGQMIRETIADPDRRNLWASRGKETVRLRYSWPDVAERYLGALNEAADRRRHKV